MALFGTKKKQEPARSTETSAPVLRSLGGARDLSHILLHARVTEKATMHSAQSVYTFDIATRATKRDVMQAVKKLYGVTPRKVAVVTVPSKTKRSARTGKTGVKTGGKKAYVYLKKGETITIS